jgi:hypothetical protein
MMRNLSKKTFIPRKISKKTVVTTLFLTIIFFIGIDKAISKKFNHFTNPAIIRER